MSPGQLMPIVPLALTAAAAAGATPTYQTPRVAQSPVLDGRLDDVVWRNAPEITGLVTNREHEPAEFSTSFRFVYDDEALYVAVEAEDAPLDKLKIGSNEDNVWHDDCVEIFLDPHATRKRYFQYIVNAGGLVSGGYVGDFAADVGGDAVAGRTDQAWTLEVRIPFARIGPVPHLGERWGLNVTRCRNPKGEDEKREVTLWCPTDGQHGAPGKFGYLVFANVPGEALPRENPELAPGDHILDRIRAEMHGQWRWTDEDVTFESGNARARNLVGLMTIMARFPETRLLYFVRPAIRDEHILPWTVPDPSEVGGEINVTACRGEFESATLGVFAIKDLDQVSITHSDLVTDDGAKLPASIADLYHVICWYQAGVSTIHPSAKTLVAEPLMKDPSLVTYDSRKRENRLAFDVIPTDTAELQPVDVPAYESRQFWITYHVPSGAEPGRYKGRITIRDGEGRVAEVPTSLRVPSWELAESPMLHGLYYARRMEGVKTVEDEKAFFEVYEQELRDQIEHGCNVVATYVHTGSLPSDNSPTATAQRIHEIMSKYGADDTPYFGVVDHVGFQQGEEQLRQVTQRAAQMAAWAKSAGRPAFCFQGRDEASGDRFREQRPSWEACRAGGGKVWVATSDNYFDVMGDILDFPVVAGGLRPELAKKVHAKGFRILSYGNPQVGIERPGVYRRNYGLALRAAGYDGAINYEYRTIDPVQSWDDFDHHHYRDHNFAYPARGKPVDTIQFEGWREGVDDVRYAQTLQIAIATAVYEGRQIDLAAESQGWLDAISGYDDPDRTRAEMIRRIDALMP